MFSPFREKRNLVSVNLFATCANDSVAEQVGRVVKSVNSEMPPVGVADGCDGRVYSADVRMIDTPCVIKMSRGQIIAGHYSPRSGATYLFLRHEKERRVVGCVCEVAKNLNLVKDAVRDGAIDEHVNKRVGVLTTRALVGGEDDNIKRFLCWRHSSSSLPVGMALSGYHQLNL